MSTSITAIAAAPSPVAAKVSKKSKKEQVPVAAPVETESDTVGTVEETKDETAAVSSSVEDSIDKLIAERMEYLARIKSEIPYLKDLKRAYRKELNTFKKKGAGRKQPTAKVVNRPPSGITMPGPISDELCNFLKVPVGTQMARTNVTKLLTKYVKENNLEVPGRRKWIMPDASLAKLFGFSDTEPYPEVDYFKMQNPLNPHFLKRPEVQK